MSAQTIRPDKGYGLTALDTRPGAKAVKPIGLNSARKQKGKEIQKVEWCPEAESNHRHADFQSAALPTELPGHFAWRVWPWVGRRCRFLDGRVLKPAGAGASRYLGASGGF